jgi:hypothetical protein
MSIKINGEAEIIREASEILFQHLSPSKLARFWANWQLGQGDYLRWRNEFFANHTVSHLYTTIEFFQERHNQ